MLSWVSVDARTGTVLADLPNLVPQSPAAKTLGRYETLSFQLPLPDAVIAYAQDQTGTAPLAQFTDWQNATRPGAVVLIALDENNLPCWGGLILTRTTDHTEVASLSTVTLEGYFDRRYVGPYNVIGRDQNLIVSDLINQFILDGTLPGLPVRVQYTASATTKSVVYNDYDDKTIYSILGTMSGESGGPQWTVNWEWSTSTKITPVLVVADRVGTSAAAGLSPNAVFSLPGCVQQFEFIEDWAAGKGANRVTATGQGQGLTRPEATLTEAATQGRPTYEYRYAPQAAPFSLLTVQQHALAALAFLQTGTKTLTLTASTTGAASAPVLGVDWNIGDDIGIDVFGPSCIDGSLQNLVGRCIGWQRTDTTVTPVLFVQEAGQL